MYRITPADAEGRSGRSTPGGPQSQEADMMCLVGCIESDLRRLRLKWSCPTFRTMSGELRHQRRVYHKDGARELVWRQVERGRVNVAELGLVPPVKNPRGGSRSLADSECARARFLSWHPGFRQDADAERPLPTLNALGASREHRLRRARATREPNGQRTHPPVWLIAGGHLLLGAKSYSYPGAGRPPRRRPPTPIAGERLAVSSQRPLPNHD